MEDMHTEIQEVDLTPCATGWRISSRKESKPVDSTLAIYWNSLGSF